MLPVRLRNPSGQTKERIQFRLNSAGRIQFLTKPPVPFLLSNCIRARFSEIVPVNPVLFIVFRAIRLFFGESGRMAQWTRGWKCKWTAVILMGDNKGATMTSDNRQALIDWEHERFCKPRFDI